MRFGHFLGLQRLSLYVTSAQHRALLPPNDMNSYQTIALSTSHVRACRSNLCYWIIWPCLRLLPRGLGVMDVSGCCYHAYPMQLPVIETTACSAHTGTLCMTHNTKVRRSSSPAHRSPSRRGQSTFPGWSVLRHPSYRQWACFVILVHLHCRFASVRRRDRPCKPPSTGITAATLIESYLPPA